MASTIFDDYKISFAITEKMEKGSGQTAGFPLAKRRKIQYTVAVKFCLGWKLP